MSVKEVFLDLVSMGSGSDETSETTPSTSSQKVLGAHLVEHMKAIGIADAYMDEETGCVYGTVPATEPRKNTVGFIAHMDTYGGVPGDNIKPQIIEQYDGGVIPLGTSGLSLSPETDPALQRHVGKTLITTDGTTLLGGDDKAGVAEILVAAEEILKEGKPHGTMKLAFTPDEEIGRGADHFDVAGFGADYAYTVDGGSLGGLDYENFNAASAKVEVTGVSTHTGGAKGRMVNSMKVAMEYCDLLPKGQAPEYTEGREGFFHVDSIQGNVEYTVVQFLIRDHDKDLFQQKKELMKQAAAYINAKYPTHPLTLTVEDSYYNMKEKILPQKEILENMEQAMRENGVEPHSEPVRGGTDGARLSYEGLPCPNLCTGGYNAHSRTEYVVLEEMETIKDIIKTAIYLAE